MPPGVREIEERKNEDATVYPGRCNRISFCVHYFSRLFIIAAREYDNAVVVENALSGENP